MFVCAIATYGLTKRNLDRVADCLLSNKDARREFAGRHGSAGPLRLSGAIFLSEK